MDPFTDGNGHHDFCLPSSLELLQQQADILDTGKRPGVDRGSIREGEGERPRRPGLDSQEVGTGMGVDSTEVDSMEEGNKEEGRGVEQLHPLIRRRQRNPPEEEVGVGIRGTRRTREGGNDADTRPGEGAAAAADTGGGRRLPEVEVAGRRRMRTLEAAAAAPGRADHRFRQLYWCFETLRFHPFLRTEVHR